MAQQAQNELEVPKNMESKNDKAHSSDLHDNEIFEELPITTESILDLIKNLKRKKWRT